jgi:hypothetical protein
VRDDLETAMGVAITSRSACEALQEDPTDYAEVFGLSDDERSVLIAMTKDLADLMPSFVTKRERMLQRAMRLTMALLEEYADDFVEEYSDEHPAVERMAADMLEFADFLAEEVAAAADEIPYAAVIADVARFERLRLTSFHTPLPLWPEPPLAPAGPDDPPRTVALHPTAVFDHFGWDLRSLRGPADLPRMREDPCVLLYFQWGVHGAQRVLRLDPPTVQALTLIGERPASMTAAQVCEAIGTDRPPESLLGKLIRQGAVREVV